MATLALTPDPTRMDVSIHLFRDDSEHEWVRKWMDPQPVHQPIDVTHNGYILVRMPSAPLPFTVGLLFLGDRIKQDIRFISTIMPVSVIHEPDCGVMVEDILVDGHIRDEPWFTFQPGALTHLRVYEESGGFVLRFTKAESVYPATPDRFTGTHLLLIPGEMVLPA